MKFIKIFAGVVALSTILCGCAGTAQSGKSDDLMKNIEARKISVSTDGIKNNNTAITDFSLRLFRNCLSEDENTLVSPLSVISTLSMVANGADNNTLSEVETTLGLPVDKLNDYIYNYMQIINKGEDKSLKSANAIWLRDAEFLKVSEEFLQTNADYYGAGIYKAPFDHSTLNDINNWVSDNTDKMIPEILEDISDDAVMYLVNALAFENEWQTPYEDRQVKEKEFHNYNGSTTTCDIMCSEEILYLEDEYATGFIKKYKGDKYAFAALLPNENVSISEYAEKLTADNLNKMLSDPEYCNVLAYMPKFETEYSLTMNENLKNMGINDAFNPEIADFTKLGTSDRGNIFIGQVIHKTFITVDQNGTKAAAATVVEMVENGAVLSEEPVIHKIVNLDRPFIYMLLDLETNTPFFIGALINI